MKHYTHPERLEVLKRLEEQGETPELSALCSVLAAVGDLTSNPSEVTCPECLTLLRASGMTDRNA